MRPERVGAVAWSLFGAALLLALAGAILGIQVTSTSPDLLVTVAILSVVSSIYPAVGAFIASRQPANAIPWILVAAGLAMAVVSATAGYARYSLASSAGRLPATEIAAWVASWVFVPALALAGAFLLLHFPSGRPPSNRWTAVVWFTGIATVASAIGYALRPGPLAVADALENPFGVDAAAALLDFLADAGDIIFPVVVALGAASMLVRYQRAAAEERRQIAWFAYAACLLAVGLLVALLTGGALVALGWVIAGVGLAALPIAVAIAVTRYRLYDIDLIVNRTLVYVGLIGVLGGLYSASIALFQRLFVAVTGDTSDAAVVVTTLILAGVFTPMRRALEGIVDRRFKRGVREEPAGEPPGAGAITRRDLQAAMEPVLRRISALERRDRRSMRTQRDRGHPDGPRPT